MEISNRITNSDRLSFPCQPIKPNNDLPAMKLKNELKQDVFEKQDTEQKTGWEKWDAVKALEEEKKRKEEEFQKLIMKEAYNDKNR